MIYTESKKILIIRILAILEQNSNSEHLLTYNDIIDLLKSEFNTECERKAIGRNITFLKEANYPIISTKNGVYLESRLFENSELRLLIDSVLASRHINENHSRQLIDKLYNLGGIYFKKKYRNIRISDWDKSQNNGFFLSIEIIDEAIDKCRQIEFTYNYYDIDKKLHPRKDYKYLVNPYQMLLHNQRYYLIGNVDKYDTVIYFRIDRITAIEILDSPIKPLNTLPNHLNGLNLAKIPCENPYMFTGEKETIIMLLGKGLIGDIIDWFGDSFTILEIIDENIRIRLNANVNSVRYWAMQYGTNVEIVEPDNLRQTIIADIESMAKKYNISK